jgi:hypothetical protein
MAKKSKRQVRKVSTGQRASQDMGAGSTTMKAADQGFNPDYTYVIKDLRRIGILAGTFLVILVILSFIPGI